MRLHEAVCSGRYEHESQGSDRSGEKKPSASGKRMSFMDAQPRCLPVGVGDDAAKKVSKTTTYARQRAILAAASRETASWCRSTRLPRRQCTRACALPYLNKAACRRLAAVANSLANCSQFAASEHSAFAFEQLGRMLADRCEGVDETRRLCASRNLRTAINRSLYIRYRLAAAHVHCADPWGRNGRFVFLVELITC